MEKTVSLLGSAEVSTCLRQIEKELDTEIEVVYCNPSHYCIFKGERWLTESARWVLPDEIWAETINGEYIVIKERDNDNTDS